MSRRRRKHPVIEQSVTIDEARRERLRRIAKLDQELAELEQLNIAAERIRRNHETFVEVSAVAIELNKQVIAAITAKRNHILKQEGLDHA